MQKPIKKNIYQVLLAEDDPTNAEFINTILGRYNFAVRVAGDGRAALQYLEQESFDLFVCDIMMPHLDGLKLLETLKAREIPMPPILMLTALSDHDTVQKAKGLGASSYLIKPIGAAQFIAKVRSVMALDDENLVDKNLRPFSVQTGVAGDEIVISVTGCPLKNPQGDLIKAMTAALAVRHHYASAQIQVGRDLIYDAEPFTKLAAMAQYLQRIPGIAHHQIQFTGGFFAEADVAALAAFKARYQVAL
ncbi:MAG: response regulator [Turneriella sp.]|nr:response regulator [Turneriella sp.]